MAGCRLQHVHMCMIQVLNTDRNCLVDSENRGSYLLGGRAWHGMQLCMCN